MMAIKAEEPVGTVRSKEIKEINEVDAFLNTLVYSPTDLTNTNIIIFDINSYGHVNHNFISELKKRKLAKIYPDYIQNMIILDTSHFITPDMFYILDDHMTPLGQRTVAEKILEYIQ